jgi:hypothetical protein
MRIRMMRLALITIPVGAFIKACRRIVRKWTGPVFKVIYFNAKASILVFKATQKLFEIKANTIFATKAQRKMQRNAQRIYWLNVL